MLNRFQHFTLNIFRISRYWNVIANEVMKKYDLKGVYALYLIILYHNSEGITAAKIADLSCRDKAEISRAVSAFEEQGLIAEKNSSNYRAPLRLSQKGMKIAGAIESKVFQAVTQASGEISDKDRQNMYECLDIIADNLKKLSDTGLE